MMVSEVRVPGDEQSSGMLTLTRAPSSGGVGNQPLHPRKVGGLRGYGDEHHVGTVVVRLRKGVHDRSCMGHRNHGEEVGPHQACDHEAANVHNRHHACHKTRGEVCVGDSHRGGGCSHEGDRDGRSSRRMARVGIRHRDGPWGSGIGIYHGPGHQDHQGLRKEREA